MTSWTDSTSVQLLAMPDKYRKIQWNVIDKSNIVDKYYTPNMLC